MNNTEKLIAKIRLAVKPITQFLYILYIPFSPVIIEKIIAFKNNKRRQQLLEEIVNDSCFELIDLGLKNGTKALLHPKHKKGKGWNHELEIAKDINNSGVDICFLPEYDEEVSADAITKIHGKWVVVDLKYSKSTNWNTIASNLEKGFNQAGNVVIKLSNSSLGEFRDAVEYITRNNKPLGSIKVINRNGRIKDISKEWLKNKKYQKELKGFL